MSKIAMEYSGKKYTLEYSRQSVRMMESQGFVAEQLFTKPMTMIPIMFQGAFAMHHKGIKRKEMDDIYNSLTDKSGLIVALAELYSDTVSTLIDDTDEGNVSWAVTK